MTIRTANEKKARKRKTTVVAASRVKMKTMEAMTRSEARSATGRIAAARVLTKSLAENGVRATPRQVGEIIDHVYKSPARRDRRALNEAFRIYLPPAQRDTAIDTGELDRILDTLKLPVTKRQA